jgi:hypothetical protein
VETDIRCKMESRQDKLYCVMESKRGSRKDRKLEAVLYEEFRMRKLTTKLAIYPDLVWRIEAS